MTFTGSTGGFFRDLFEAPFEEPESIEMFNEFGELGLKGLRMTV